MKKTNSLLLVAFIITILPHTLFADESTAVKKEKTRTLIDLSDNIRLSGYGAPVLSYTKMGDEHLLLMGLRAALTLNNFGIGFEGSTLSSSIDYTKAGGTKTDLYKKINYSAGGLFLEYHFFPKNLLNFTVSAMIGAGGTNALSKDDFEWQEDEPEKTMKNGEPFFTAMPALTVYLNLAKFCRFGITGAYRYNTGINRSGLSDDIFRGFSGGIVVSFGWF